MTEVKVPVVQTHTEPVPVPQSPNQNDVSSEAPTVAGVVNVHETVDAAVPVKPVEHPVADQHQEHHEG